MSKYKDMKVYNLQQEILRKETEIDEQRKDLENTRERLLGILIEKGIFKSESEYYDLRNEYRQLHLVIHVAGRKYNTNVMIINMGMSWEDFELSLFRREPDKKIITERIQVLKADFERVKEMFKAEYVKEIKLQ